MTTGNTLADILIGTFIVLAILTRIVWAIKTRLCPVCARFIKKKTVVCYHCGYHSKKRY